ARAAPFRLCSARAMAATRAASHVCSSWWSCPLSDSTRSSSSTSNRRSSRSSRASISGTLSTSAPCSGSPLVCVERHHFRRHRHRLVGWVRHLIGRDPVRESFGQRRQVLSRFLGTGGGVQVLRRYPTDVGHGGDDLLHADRVLADGSRNLLRRGGGVLNDR